MAQVPSIPEPEVLPAFPTPNPYFWLDRYQGCITRSEFESRLHTLFDPFNGLAPYVSITDEAVTLYPSPKIRDLPVFRLTFAQPGKTKPVPRLYRTPEEFRAIAKPTGRPLEGLRLAIDPGHIGGEWGDIEQRSTPYYGIGRIQEGDCNIITARLLRDQLTALGAKVFLVRETNDPVSPYRPKDFKNEALNLLLEKTPSLATLPPDVQQKRLAAKIKNTSEFLFYRGSEIEERGWKIRNEFPADLTITLYINATPSSSRRRLTPANQLIFFVHGSYTKKEAGDPRQQIRMLDKIVHYATPIEVKVAAAIAGAFKDRTGLRPVPYADSPTTRQVIPDNLYVVARNLAANREYDGPVVCTEPYFMNNATVARRLLAGDYEGTQEILGKPVPSIYREYADCVVAGLLAAYSGTPPPLSTASGVH